MGQGNHTDHTGGGEWSSAEEVTFIAHPQDMWQTMQAGGEELHAGECIGGGEGERASLDGLLE